VVACLNSFLFPFSPGKLQRMIWPRGSPFLYVKYSPCPAKGTSASTGRQLWRTDIQWPLYGWASLLCPDRTKPTPVSLLVSRKPRPLELERPQTTDSDDHPFSIKVSWVDDSSKWVSYVFLFLLHRDPPYPGGGKGDPVFMARWVPPPLKPEIITRKRCGYT